MKYSKAYYLLCALGFLVILGGNVCNPFLPLYAEELGSSEIFIGIIVSSFFLSRVFVEIPAGYISDLIGYRSPLILGFAVSTLAAVIAALATSPFHLVASRALWGIGSALFFNLSTNVVVSAVGKEDIGEALGVFQGIEFIGSFMGAPIGGFIAVLFGYRAVFAVSAGILLITVFGMMVSKELKAATSRETIQRGRDPKESGSWKDAMKAMRNYTFGVVCLTGFLRMFAMMGILSTIAPIFLNSVLGFDVAAIGILLGLNSVGMSLSNLLAGRAAKVAGKPFIYVTSLLLMGATVLSMAVFPSFEVQMIVFFLNGVATGILMPLLPVTIIDLMSPSVRGTAIGFFRTSFDIGSVIAPILLTWIATVWRIEGCFYLTAAVLLFNAVLSLTLRGRIN